MIDAVGEAPAPRLRSRRPEALSPPAARSRRARAPKAAAARSPPRRRARARRARRPRGAAAAAQPEPERAARAGHPLPAPPRAGGERHRERAPAPRPGAGLARTRSGFIARLGEIFTGRSSIDPVRRRRDREGAADRRHRRPHQPEAAGGDPQLAVATASSPIPTRSGRSCAGAARRCCRCPRRPSTSRAAQPVRAAGHRRQRQRQDHDDRQAGRASWRPTARRSCSPPATPSAPPPSSSSTSGRSARATTLVRGKEGADPSSVIFDGVKRGATEGFDVVDRRHRRPPAHQDRADAGAAEGPARGRQGEPGRAARDLAGDRLDQRPERDRAGADLHRGDGGVAASC